MVTEAIRAELDSVLGGLLARGEEVGYVNFPNIGNPGDAAVYLGARASLARLGVRVRVVVEARTYRRADLVRWVGESGTILIQGGGNFGDLYSKQPQQVTRRALLRDFPNGRLIQLPQSIYFHSERRGQSFAARCRTHRDLTILVRDGASVDRAATLGLETTLCPDAAFGLGAMARTAPVHPVAWLLRDDVERAIESPGSGSDWPTGAEQRSHPGELPRAIVAVERLHRLRSRLPARARGALANRQGRSYDRLAEARLALALAQVGTGEALVTDRLHAHVLACMLDIPNVLLDNSYGKNRALYESWTHRYGCTAFAEDRAGAGEIAQSLRGA